MNHISTALVLFLYFGISSCTDIKLYQQNHRVTGVKFTKKVRSLVECTLLYRIEEGSFSFNYKPGNKMCELSDRYPEYYTVSDTGTLVYSNIVDGSWSSWLQWSSCSVTCGEGIKTRTRTCTNPSPSNGGISCADHDSEHLTCNIQKCLVASNYFFSTNGASWFDAQASCNGMSGHLLIIDNQAEQDFIEALTGSALGHWIGLRCLNMNCAWVDGRSLSGGYISWAPGEPGDRECVWIGYYGNRWDDDYCDVLYKYICEF